MIDQSTLAGSTLEILSLLAVAFLLGYLLKLLMGNKWKSLYKSQEEENLKLTNVCASNNSKIKSLEDSNNFLRSELEKSKKTKPAFTAPIAPKVNTPASTSNGKVEVKAPQTIAKVKAPAVSVPDKKVVTQTLKSSTNSSIKKTSSKTAASKASAKPKAAPKKSTKKDDLKKIEGIGPKIEQIFNKAGLKSFEDVAGSTPTKLKKILSEAGPRYKMHDPKTWPRQAKLASSGNWKRLKTLQDSLKGGRA